MKRKPRKYKSKTSPIQERRHTRNNQNYNDFSSNLNCTDYYQHNYRGFSKYRYINHSVRKPFKINKRKFPSRPASPVLGSEEYMKKKIEETSAIIMRQLLNPDECTYENAESSSKKNCMEPNENAQIENEIVESSSVNNKIKNKKDVYNIDEIHKKIVNHITKLNDGKKKNLINSNISGYDIVIEQIVKQKRLEISRALRAVCSQTKESEKSSDFINSIIPDMGIKIEDLPRDLIEELTNTLNLDPDWGCNDDLMHNFSNGDEFSLGINQNSTENVLTHGQPSEVYIKTEHPDDCVLKDELKFEINNGDLECNKIDSEARGLNNTDKGFEHNCKETQSINNNEIAINTETSKSNNPGNSLLERNNENLERIKIDSATISLNNTNKGSENNYNNTHFINNDENVINIGSSINNNTENSLIVIKKEICEESEFEHYDTYAVDNYKENSVVEENLEYSFEKDNTEVTTIKVENKEIENMTEGEIQKEYVLKTPVPVEASEKQIFQSIQVNRDNYFQSNVSTQTENETYSADKFINMLLATCYKIVPKNISEAISRMYEIDRCVLKLTNYRQSLFTTLNLSNDGASSNKSEMNHGLKNKKRKKRPIKLCNTKKKKSTNSVNQINATTNNAGLTKNGPNVSTSMGIGAVKDAQDNIKDKSIHSIHKDKTHDTKCNSESIIRISQGRTNTLGKSTDTNTKHNDTVSKLDTVDCRNRKYSELLNIHEKILVIKIVGDKLVAGAESGKIIFFSLETGIVNKILDASNVPITSLLFISIDKFITYMCVGSFDTVLKVYNLSSLSVIETVSLYNRVQCMEYNWGYIFIGCMEGSFFRYKVAKNMVEYEDKFSDSSILVLKTAQEGARRIILVGSRNSPVCIRDAMNGLYMRTMENIISPTVYSLILENNLVYCGTTNHDILVYSFYDGKLIHRHKPTNSKGIGCMKIDRNLLFASCHNGNIYVYDSKTNEFISTIEGPGGVILSMEVFDNQIIIGTMSRKFMSLSIPQDILRHKVDK